MPLIRFTLRQMEAFAPKALRLRANDARPAVHGAGRILTVAVREDLFISRVAFGADLHVADPYHRAGNLNSIHGFLP